MKFINIFLVICFILLTSKNFLRQSDHNAETNRLFNFIDEKNSNLEFKKKCDQNQTESFAFNFVKKYPWIKECKTNSSVFSRFNSSSQIEFDYNQPSPNQTHDIRIIRAVFIQFPIDKIHHYQYEFRWFYRSWIEMQKYEPPKWRTDLVVFIKKDHKFFNDSNFFFNQLNCSFSHKRKSPLDQSMCTLLDYTPLKDRVLQPISLNFSNNKQLYDFVLNQINIFDDSDKNMNIFNYFMTKTLSNYRFGDSIVIGFDGYDYFRKVGFDYIIRSDIDVFLTPLFGKWLPKNCNDFYVGGGDYSTDFNMNRLKRISANLGFGFASVRNVGSTWYSTPDQIRLLSYLTLFGMAYIAIEEFTRTERQLGSLLWPDWHYGVLSLYGQNLINNHFIKTQQLNIVRLIDHFDYPSHLNTDVNKVLHIHVYHVRVVFSKFDFKEGKYDNLTMSVNLENSEKVKDYSLRIALESKRMSFHELNELLLSVTAKKE